MITFMHSKARFRATNSMHHSHGYCAHKWLGLCLESGLWLRVVFRSKYSIYRNIWQCFILSVNVRCCFVPISITAKEESMIIDNDEHPETHHLQLDTPVNDHCAAPIHQWPATLNTGYENGKKGNAHWFSTVWLDYNSMVNFTYLLRGRQSPWQAARQPWWVVPPTYQLGGCAQPCPQCVCVCVWPQSSAMKAQSAQYSLNTATTNYYLLCLHQCCTPRTRISYILMLATGQEPQSGTTKDCGTFSQAIRK